MLSAILLERKVFKATDSSAAASMDANAVSRCARVFSRTFNNMDLPQHIDWGHRYPQGENESGTDYMTRLALFKVVRWLWVQVKSAGDKPSRCLGRSTLQVVFPEVEAVIFADTQASTKAAGVTEEQLRAFLDGFRSTLTHVEGAAEGSPDSDLVWAEQYSAVLAARQAARKAEAAERAERAASADEFADELRSAVVTASPEVGSSTGGSSVRIEEVDA